MLQKVITKNQTEKTLIDLTKKIHSTNNEQQPPRNRAAAFRYMNTYFFIATIQS